MARILNQKKSTAMRPGFRATKGFAACLIFLTFASHGQPPPLPDQFGDVGQLGDHLGSVQVVIVVSAKRLRRIKPWERALREHYGNVPLLRVADVPRATEVEYEAVAAKLRKRLPDDINVLIDLEGRWSGEYALDTRVPNVLVFDTAGELVARHAGKYRSARFDALRVDLERLVRTQ